MKNNFPTDTSKYKLIVSDFDGTLAQDDHTISDVVVQAVKKWISKGNRFCIASGRQYLMMKDECDKLGLKTPIITRGGAEIVDPVTGEVLISSHIEYKDISHIVARVLSSGARILVEKDNLLYSNFKYEIDFRYLEYRDISKFPQESAPKMVAYADPSNFEQLSELMDGIAKEYPHLSIARSFSTVGKAWDITPLSATKLQGVLEILKLTGIDKSQTVGVGDSYNDFPLLEAAGFKVAMGNANDELKAIADVVVPSNGEDGVAYLIERLLRNVGHDKE